MGHPQGGNHHLRRVGSDGRIVTGTGTVTTSSFTWTPTAASSRRPRYFDFQASTVSLAGKKLTLAWVAASAADQQALEALLPKPHPDGRPIQPSELPTSLPRGRCGTSTPITSTTSSTT